MTEDLNAIELAEYEDSMTKLVDDPSFRRLLVAQYVNTRPDSYGPLSPESLLNHNFNLGAHTWVKGVVEWLEDKQPAAYFQFLQEVYTYEYRRRRTDADHRNTADD